MPHWLEVIRALWPFAVVITPLVLGSGFLWLKTQLATKAELSKLETETEESLNKVADRFERGSQKFAEQDRRLALVEKECESVPSRQTLQSELSGVAQRLRGVESGFDGIRTQLGTTNDYLKIIVDKGMKP